MKLRSMRETSETVNVSTQPAPSSSNRRRNSLPVLPREIIEEILSWLPVRTLIQFRCVSKSFNSLISDPQFVKTHLRKVKSSLQNDPSHHQRLVYTYHKPEHRLLRSCFSLYSIYNNSLSNATGAYHFPLEDGVNLMEQEQINKYQLYGSCDGLVCVFVQQKFVALWNPSTRVFSKMPDLDFDFKQWHYLVFGFGYDSEMDDYKVVVVAVWYNIIADADGDGDIILTPSCTRVKVCSRRTNRWRDIGGFRYGVPCYAPGKYVNGSLFWSMIFGSGSSIVSFDVAKETYKEIIPPNYGGCCNSETLKVLKDFLCVHALCFGGRCGKLHHHVDVWVMEYRGSESWTKLFSLPDPAFQIESLSLRRPWPIYIAGNGEILLNMIKHDSILHYSSILLIYNPKNCTFRKCAIQDIDLGHDAEVYLESLVSPSLEN